MPDIVRFLNRRARSEGHVRFGDPVDVSSSCMSWQCEHAPAGAFADSCRPTRDNRVPIAAFAADPSSSDMHSIPCPDALRDGSQYPVEPHGRYRALMCQALPEGIHAGDVVAVEA
jgi:hypothetical protein